MSPLTSLQIVLVKISLLRKLWHSLNSFLNLVSSRMISMKLLCVFAYLYCTLSLSWFFLTSNFWRLWFSSSVWASLTSFSWIIRPPIYLCTAWRVGLKLRLTSSMLVFLASDFVGEPWLGLIPNPSRLSSMLRYWRSISVMLTCLPPFVKLVLLYDACLSSTPFSS